MYIGNINNNNFYTIKFWSSSISKCCIQLERVLCVQTLDSDEDSGIGSLYSLALLIIGSSITVDENIRVVSYLQLPVVSWGIGAIWTL